MTPDTSSRKSIRAAEKAARLAAAERADVTRLIMSTTQGRAWMWDHLAACRIFTTTFSPNPNQSAFAEGERNAGLRLLADIMLNCPDQFIQAQREANERSSIADARDNRGPVDERRSSEVADGGDSRPSDGDDDRDETHDGNEADRAYGNYN